MASGFLTAALKMRRADLRRLKVHDLTLGQLTDLLDRRYLISADTDAAEYGQTRRRRWGGASNGFEGDLSEPKTASRRRRP